MSDTVSREPRRDCQFRLDHIQRWKYSGLSKADYFERHQLKIGSFYNRSSKTTASKSVDADTILNLTPAAPNFLPVNVMPSSSHLPSGQFVHVVRAATEIALPAEMSPE